MPVMPPRATLLLLKGARADVRAGVRADVGADVRAGVRAGVRADERTSARAADARGDARADARIVALAVALAVAPFAAQSQAAPGQFTLFRCGSQGQELRNTPCPQEPGASEVRRYDPGSPEAAAAARERAIQEARLTERLGREREARARAEREALEQAPRGVTIGPVPAKAPASVSGAASAPGQAPVHRTAKSTRSKPGHKHPRPARRPQPSRDE